MAFNMDKLEQQRKKFTKPKLAVKECNKRLQKQPKDPYLLVGQYLASIVLFTDGDFQRRGNLSCSEKPTVMRLPQYVTICATAHLPLLILVCFGTYTILHAMLKAFMENLLILLAKNFKRYGRTRPKP
jgi:hypothetical protein